MAIRILGDSTDDHRMVVRIAENVGAGGLAAPSSSTAGLDLVELRRVYGGKFDLDDARLVVTRVSGTNVTVASVTQHRMLASRESGDGLDKWDARKTCGYGTTALESSNGVDILKRAEANNSEQPALSLVGLDRFDRVAVSLGVVGGTGTPVVHVDAIFSNYNDRPVRQFGDH